MGQPLQSSRPSDAGARRSLLFGHYPTGFMVGLTLALTTVVLAIQVPLGRAPGAVHWHLTGAGEAIELEALTEPRTVPLPEGAPVTRFEGDDAAESDASSVQDEKRPADEPLPVPSSEAPDQKLGSMAVMTAADIMPKVEGGLRNYYIHIEYPEAAARAGIEGLLVLDFVVSKDGTVRDIEVAEPLHPLCDSAAVQALRRTQFIPARHEGRNIAVRMHLPVRFQLVESPLDDLPGRRTKAERDP